MFSHIIPRSFFMIIIMLLSTNVVSREISYDYIQGTYSSTTDSSLPGGDVDGDGFGVTGSFSVIQNLAISVGYEKINFDRHQGVDIDTSQFALGITLHAPIAVGTDVVGNLSAIKAKAEINNGIVTLDNNDTGLVARIGLRHLITREIEIDVNFSYTDVFDNNFSAFGLGARFYVNKQISFGLGYATGDDVDTLLLNARFDI